MKTLLISAFLSLFFFSCEESSSVDYTLPERDYHIKIEFVVEDGTSPETLHHHVENISYRVTTKPQDSLSFAVVDSGDVVANKILLADERYKEGLYSGYFSWKDGNGIDLYSRAIAADTVIRKLDDRPLEWRIKLIRTHGLALFLTDTALHPDFKYATARFHNTFMDSVIVDSLTLSSNTFINSVYSGEYNATVVAHFADTNGVAYSRDSLISSLKFSSDTTTIDLRELIRE